MDEQIWLSELQFSSSRSSGAGGQHVNKVESKAEIRWNVTQSKAITEAEKNILLQNLANKLTSAGEIVLYNQTTRSQLKNKQLVQSALRHLIDKASHVKKLRRKSKPTVASEIDRQEGKQRRSAIKKLRSKLDY